MGPFDGDAQCDQIAGGGIQRNWDGTELRPHHLRVQINNFSGFGHDLHNDRISVLPGAYYSEGRPVKLSNQSLQQLNVPLAQPSVQLQIVHQVPHKM